MHKFNVGDKVRIIWSDTAYVFDGYKSTGVVVGHWGASLISVGGFLDKESDYNLSFREDQLELIAPRVPKLNLMLPDSYFSVWDEYGTGPFIQTKPKTFMKTITNYIKKTVDPKTQLLLKAGLINGDLEPTSAGREVLTEILWFQNLEAIATRAQEIVTEADKESK